MNRTDFMKQLESLLQNISPAEREEALQYYNEYFNDAGEENEQQVIEALGNPAKVAENIKKDLYGSGYGDNVYGGTYGNDNAVIEYSRNGQDTYTQDKQEKKMSTGMIVLIVVLCVLASPAILGALSGVAGTLIGIVVSWFALIFAFGAVAVVLLLVLLVFIVTGVMCIFTDPLVGVVALGSGMVCGGIGILFLMLTVAMAGIATPAICKGVAYLFQKMTTSKKTA